MLLDKFKQGLKDEFRRKTSEVSDDRLHEVLDKASDAVEAGKEELSGSGTGTDTVAEAVDATVDAVRGVSGDAPDIPVPEADVIKKAFARIAEVVDMEMALRYRRGVAKW